MLRWLGLPGSESLYDTGLNCWGSESKSDGAENKEVSDEHRHSRSYLM
jgi:hypothetical protein